MSPEPGDARALELARIRTYTQRRHRLVRRVAVGLALTLIMVVLAAGNRDAQAMREARVRCEQLVEALTAARARLGAPPLQIPDIGPRTALVLGSYYFNIRYAQGASGRWVGVCCPRSPLQLFVWADGRHVILFDGQQFTWRWMPEAEFRAQAAALGFDGLVQD